MALFSWSDRTRLVLAVGEAVVGHQAVDVGLNLCDRRDGGVALGFHRLDAGLGLKRLGTSLLEQRFGLRGDLGLARAVDLGQDLPPCDARADVDRLGS